MKAILETGRGTRPARLPVGSPVSPVGRLRRRRSDALTGYLCLTPATALLLLFIVAPAVAAVVVSFTDYSLLPSREGTKFVGLDNYSRLLHDSHAWRALLNTTVFSFAAVITQVGAALGLAVAVNGMRSKVGSYLFKGSLFFPFAMSWASVALIWTVVLDPSLGFVNYYLAKIGIHAPNWAVSKSWALPALIGVNLWFTLGFMFVIMLAGLKAVPKELVDAATIDGANAWRRFFHVTLPAMSPTLFFGVAFAFIGSYQVFEPMFIITKGGPGDATESMVQYVYEAGFTSYQMGYASALSVLLLAAILVITAALFGLSRKLVHYDGA